MARLHADENFPLLVVEALRSLGRDILTVLEEVQAEQAITDEDGLAFASEQRRSVLTLNRKHFIRLHTTYPDHMGIVG